MKTLLTAMTVLALVALLGSTALAQADLAALLRQHVDALNRSDVGALTAAFSEDAVVDGRTTQCQANNPCVGRAAIQRAMTIQVEQRVRYNIVDIQLSGSTATMRGEQGGQGVTAAGVERVLFDATVTFSGDKISRWVHRPVISDPQTAAFINFQRVTGVHNRQLTALSNGDIANVMETFSDDAVLQGVGLCVAAPCIGKAAIQKEMERQIADKAIVSVGRALQPLSRVSGDNMTRRVEIRAESIRAAGVERVMASVTAVVRGNNIVSFRQALDGTDPQTATFLQAQGRQAQPVPLPRAGGLAASLSAALGVGALLLGLGLALRRARRGA